MILTLPPLLGNGLWRSRISETSADASSPIAGNILVQIVKPFAGFRHRVFSRYKYCKIIYATVINFFSSPNVEANFNECGRTTTYQHTEVMYRDLRVRESVRVVTKARQSDKMKVNTLSFDSKTNSTGRMWSEEEIEQARKVLESTE